MSKSPLQLNCGSRSVVLVLVLFLVRERDIVPIDGDVAHGLVFWEVRGDVLAVPESALCGWQDVILPVSPSLVPPASCFELCSSWVLLRLAYPIDHPFTEEQMCAFPSFPSSSLPYLGLRLCSASAPRQPPRQLHHAASASGLRPRHSRVTTPSSRIVIPTKVWP